LDLFFYDILEVKNGDLSSHWEVLKRLKAWGLKTNSNVKKCASFKDIKKYHEKMADQREDLNYEIDGVVIKVDDLKLREKLGVRHRSPRWAMAWKFEPKEGKAVLHARPVPCMRSRGSQRGSLCSLFGGPYVPLSDRGPDHPLCFPGCHGHRDRG
jgi:NAD-dependent DNA ligase